MFQSKAAKSKIGINIEMTMNALSLYVTTTRMIFQANIEDSGAWSDINRLLSYLRQSLTCCVCGQLLHTPMSSTVSSCQHHVCKNCVGGKMRLKPSCSWCKDHSKFIENIQLRILLQCYKQLSCFVLSSPIALKWASLPCETNQGSSYSAGPNNSVISGPTTFEQLLEEGANLQDKFNFSDPPPLRGFNRHLNGHQGGATLFSNQTVKSNSNQLKPNQLENVKSGSPQSGTNQSSLTVKPESVSSTSSKSESTSSIFSNMTKATGASLISNIKSDISSSNQIQTNAPSVSRKVRRGCRCGLATPNPGKLTCCGQRCPCYVENKPCQQCKCRGCRNPNRVSNLTTINIISSNSSNSSLISIPSSSLLQIPILAGDEEESQEMITKGLSVITANVATGTEEEICEKDNICSTDVATETDPEII